jgi:hypothetical protein
MLAQGGEEKIEVWLTSSTTTARPSALSLERNCPAASKPKELALTYLARDEYHGRRFLADAHLPSYAFD